jgi:translation initiation factor IF-1
MGKKEEAIEAKGTIVSALGGDKFEVLLENGHTVTGYIAGRMRKNWIKIVPGDKVTIELSPYDLTQGRITFREK